MNLTQITELIKNNLWLAPVLSMLAGFITSFTPCCLFNVPLIIGYVDNIGVKQPKRAFLLSLTFSAGTFVTFAILGILSAAAGLVLNHLSHFWHIVLGILLMLIALNIWEIFPHHHSHNHFKTTKKGFIGAFSAGLIGGFFSTPCSAPILVAILAVISATGNFLLGFILMLFYSIGHNILVLVAGTSTGFITKLKSNGKYKALSNVLKILMGLFIFFIGILMILHAFE